MGVGRPQDYSVRGGTRDGGEGGQGERGKKRMEEIAGNKKAIYIYKEDKKKGQGQG